MLTVKEPFSLGAKSYAKGERITDPEEVKAALEHNAGNVLRTHHHAPVPTHPEKPAPVAASKADQAPAPESDTSRPRSSVKSNS